MTNMRYECGCCCVHVIWWWCWYNVLLMDGEPELKTMHSRCIISSFHIFCKTPFPWPRPTRIWADKLLHTTNNFVMRSLVMWSKIAPHDLFCCTDNVCGVCDNYHIMYASVKQSVLFHQLYINISLLETLENLAVAKNSQLRKLLKGGILCKNSWNLYFSLWYYAKSAPADSVRIENPL